MLNDFRKPLPEGTEIHCEGGVCYTITGDTVANGGSSLVYSAVKMGSERLYIIKECFPLTERFSYIRDDCWKVVPEYQANPEATWFLKTQTEKFLQENRDGQIISRNAGRAIAAWETVRAESVIVNGHEYINNSFFIIMEQLGNKGCFLADILKECAKTKSWRHLLRTSGGPSIYTITCIVEETLKALDEIHQTGYLYGDIHGGNLFFMNPHFDDGDIGVGCLLDFGTVRKLCDDGLTKEITDQEIYSTQGYTAPEIIHSNDGHLRLSLAADIFSVGCLLLYLIKGDNYARMQGKKISHIPQRNYIDRKELLSRGATENSADYLMEILNCALSFNPKKRYSNAHEMLEVISQLKALCPSSLETISRFQGSIPNVTNIINAEKHYALLNFLPPSTSFIPHSRDIELERLSADIEEKQPLWIWGFAGIGKTELAIRFAETQKKKRNCYFIHYMGSIQETICSLQFDGYSESDKKQDYSKKLEILRNQYQDCLLIIDNFDDSSRSFNEMVSESAYDDLVGLPLHVLFTTRHRPDLTTTELSSMDTFYLINMFRAIVTDTSITDGKISQLIACVNGHSLFIELASKLIEESFGEITIDQIIATINSGKGNLSKYNVEVSSQKDRDYQEKTIENHLLKLFSLSSFTATQRKILWNLSIISIKGIRVETVKEIYSQSELKDLKILIKAGWIKQVDRHLMMHPLLKSVCFSDSLTNNVWENDSFIECFCNAQIKLVKTHEHKYNDSINLLFTNIDDDLFKKYALRLSNDQLDLILLYLKQVNQWKDSAIDIIKKTNLADTLIDNHDYENAFSILISLLDCDYPRAINNLGWMYVKGYGTPVDFSKAIECWKIASDKCTNPSNTSCKHLGLLYLGQHPSVKEFNDINPEMALKYLEQAKDLGRTDVDEYIKQAQSLLNT